MSETAFWDTVDALRVEHTDYMRPAYGFVVHALTRTVEGLPEERLSDPVHRHLSGRELLEGLGRLAREEFGPMAPAVFREWGVVSSEDVGAIVFRLVEAGQLSARPEDTLADFSNGPALMPALAAPLEWGGAVSADRLSGRSRA